VSVLELLAYAVGFDATTHCKRCQISTRTSMSQVRFYQHLLCAPSVISVSLWWVFAEKIHHRDTENTKVAQRNTNWVDPNSSAVKPGVALLDTQSLAPYTPPLARGSTSCKLVVGNVNCAVISQYLENW